MVERTRAQPRIFHRDADFLVVAKPPGLPTTTPDPDRPCLVQWVAAQLVETNHVPHATSRLDSPVSGLVTFALTSRANRHLLEARRAGEYGRTYLGITTRRVSFTTARWRWPISIDPANRRLRVAGPGKGQRDAATRCELVAEKRAAALLELSPLTGRTHQIRVHAAKAAVPLFGDHAYGGDRRVVLAGGTVVAASRVMLHCAKVRFPALDGGGFIEITAPVPGDMELVWVKLGGTPVELRPHDCGG